MSNLHNFCDEMVRDGKIITKILVGMFVFEL